MNFENEIVDEIKDLERRCAKNDRRFLFFSITLFISGFLWRELHWPFAGEMIIIGNGLLVSSFLGIALANKFDFKSSCLLFFSICSFVSINFWFWNDAHTVLGIWVFLIGMVIEIQHFRNLKKKRF